MKINWESKESSSKSTSGQILLSELYIFGSTFQMFKKHVYFFLTCSYQTILVSNVALYEHAVHFCKIKTLGVSNLSNMAIYCSNCLHIWDCKTEFGLWYLLSTTATHLRTKGDETYEGTGKVQLSRAAFSGCMWSEDMHSSAVILGKMQYKNGQERSTTNWFFKKEEMSIN